MVNRKIINLQHLQISYDEIKHSNLKQKDLHNLSKLEKTNIKNLEIIKELYKNDNDYSVLMKLIKKIKPSNIILFGMGGSSLGTKAIVDALGGKNKLRIVNNPDGENFEKLFKEIKINSSFFIFISKSGDTIEIKKLLKETLIKLNKAGINYTKRILLLTDNVNSYLNRFGKRNKVPVFHLNKNIGGRFSVLSASSMIPCQSININTDELLSGARDTYDELEDMNFLPILNLVNFHYVNYLLGRDISILMSYKDSLNSFGEWFMQLWGESLGKKNIGLTPISYIGPKDQHSQMQLVLDGPKNKTLTFVLIQSSLKGNNKLEELIANEYHATVDACTKRNIPVVSFQIERLTMKSLSSLIIIFELATILLAKQLKVNPFNQPGVELIKKKLKTN